MGKSTVAVNLAYELAAQGGRVGLLDLDLYGPSLPLLVQNISDTTIRRVSPPLIGNSSDNKSTAAAMVYPLEHCGVKLLSLGFVNTHVRYTLNCVCVF